MGYSHSQIQQIEVSFLLASDIQQCRQRLGMWFVPENYGYLINYLISYLINETWFIVIENVVKIRVTVTEFDKSKNNSKIKYRSNILGKYFCNRKNY